MESSFRRAPTLVSLQTVPKVGRYAPTTCAAAIIRERTLVIERLPKTK